MNGDRSQPNFGTAMEQDYWVVKVDSMGTKEWNGAYGGANDDVLTGVDQAADGGFIMVGRSASGLSVAGSKSQASFGNNDFWAVRLGPAVLATKSSTGLAALSLYPNPSRGSFAVELPAAAPRTGLGLQLLDATGRVVWQQTALTAPAGRLAVAAGVLPAGLYLLRVQGADGYLQTQRLTLE